MKIPVFRQFLAVAFAMLFWIGVTDGVGGQQASDQISESNLQNAALIQAAVDRLLEIQEPDGAWPYEGVYRVNRKIPLGYRIGGTAIVCAALLDAPLADRTNADHAIRRAVELVLIELEHPLMKPSRENTYDVRVWGHIYALDLFVRIHSSERFPDLNTATSPWIDRLVAGLVEQEIDGGGWNYANRRRHAPFVTAPALQALALTKEYGAKVPDELFDRGASALNSSRSSNGAFAYSGATSSSGRNERLPGSIARNVVCETTLWLLGDGDSTRLQLAIDAFHEHWEELEKRRKKTGTHEPPYGVAPYYFYYGHRYLAQAIALLPADKQMAEYDRFEQVLLQTKDEDNTWNDRVFQRSRAFGTAMSVLALSRQHVPLPSAKAVR